MPSDGLSATGPQHVPHLRKCIPCFESEGRSGPPRTITIVGVLDIAQKIAEVVRSFGTPLLLGFAMGGS